MNNEYLPATAAMEQELVLLHGWGGSREIWRPLLAHLRDWAGITVLDLPGCTPGSEAQTASLTQLLQSILAVSPQRAIYVGFSLGGKLALELAAVAPERVAGVVTLCSNPSFVGSADWPGMDAVDFGRFRAAVADDCEQALRRFDGLQAMGSSRQRALQKALRQAPRAAVAAVPTTSPQLMPGLDWLHGLDQRPLVSQLSMPQRHLFAANDALVPEAITDAMENLLDDTPGASVGLIANSSHLLPLENPQQVAEQLAAFARQVPPLQGAPTPAIEVAKGEIAASFSRCATSYDSVAGLQREVGARLLARLEDIDPDPEVVLDLGCGTGFFAEALQSRYGGARYLGLDIAEGMVGFARQREASEAAWLVGDAEALPLATGSVDLVFSSLALQWCYRPALVFAELHRVLRPGGVCVLTTLGPQTLHELRAAWRAVDEHTHVNEFLPLESLQTAASAVPGLTLALERDNFVMTYDRVRDLLAELKGLGAHNMNRQRRAGLTPRRALQGMLQAYEQWRRPDGLLPATYEVVFGVVSKSVERL